nr:HAD family acid phosphatase [Sphingomonas sp. Leaf34]
MQFLYASGEAAAVSVQAWNALVGYVRAQRTPTSVVLAPGASLAAPSWTACGTKPKAAVFDVDETVLLNLGFEYDASSGRPWSESRWQEWERTGLKQVAPVPGALSALGQLRAMGVTVIFNTNRAAANAAQTQATIEAAGLGPARHGETLFLAGDDASGSKKDGRRATIAAKYCVVAMGGDQLGDFSDLFNAGQTPAARRAVVQSPAITAKWGAGWFVLPNPVYGTALKGARDDVFPPNVRWAPTGGMR